MAIRGELTAGPYFFMNILLTCVFFRSVTALKANFLHAAESLQGQDLKL